MALGEMLEQGMAAIVSNRHVSSIHHPQNTS
jgi:hypothetical protein